MQDPPPSAPTPAPSLGLTLGGPVHDDEGPDTVVRRAVLRDGVPIGTLRATYKDRDQDPTSCHLTLLYGNLKRTFERTSANDDPCEAAFVEALRYVSCISLDRAAAA